MVFSVGGAYPQSHKKLRSIANLINEGKYNSALVHLSTIDTAALSTPDAAKYYLLKAKAYSLDNIEDKAYKNLLKAKKLYLAADSLDKAMEINLELAYLVKAQKNSEHLDAQAYLDEYLAYARESKDPLILATAYAELASMKISAEESAESHEYFQKAKAINKKAGSRKLESHIDNNLAALYNEYLDMPDSALYYFKKDLEYSKKLGDHYNICINYINQAASYYYLGNYKKAVEMLTAADTIQVNGQVKSLKSIINQCLSVNYAAMGDYKRAYESFLLHKTYADSLSADEQSIAISDIQTKYQTREKELENTALKSNIKTNRILLYTFIVLLAASLVIGFLIVKNARRKEKISLQEKLIEQQKLEKALKDYELSSIDLMLEGQEKERQRIANDLHDNLGSMLATLKLNFENLKLRKNELRDEETKLYERTDELIEEAYQKVRRLAHAKNAGVLAKEGLIPALKKLAEKISIPGKLQIQIVPFGFNERIENTLEISIFRMIQELATNIIKHSQATEAVIHLTHHEDNINIIIEDNGVGFNSSKLETADGMGLNTIKKKTAQLGGSFTIDTTPGKGTTIIIDIPT